jgi:hypothetical protein
VIRQRDEEGEMETRKTLRDADIETVKHSAPRAGVADADEDDVDTDSDDTDADTDTDDRS